MQIMARTFREVLLDHLCEFEAQFRALFGLCGIIFLLLLVSLSVVEPGSHTYVIVIIDLISIAMIGAASIVILIICERREQDEVYQKEGLN